MHIGISNILTQVININWKLYRAQNRALWDTSIESLEQVNDKGSVVIVGIQVDGLNY